MIGVDPGKSGAVTILGIDRSFAQVFDVPLMIEKKGKKKKQVYNVQAMVDILRPFAGLTTLACIESVHSMPGEGSSSSFSFGRGLGLWEGIIAGLGCSYEMVTPQSWKKQWAEELLMTSISKPEILNLTPQAIKKLGKQKQIEFDEAKKEYGRKKAKQKETAKDAARQLASRLYPQLADEFVLKKHDGRAESLLIAERKRLEIENGTR